MSNRQHRLRLAGVLSAASGLIHVVAAAEHLREWWFFALLFMVSAVLQIAWMVRAWNRGSRPLALAGIALNLGIALAWALSRIRGLPIGPERWEPEKFGILDVQSTVDELLVCVLAASAVWCGRRLSLRLVPFFEVLGLGSVVATFLVLAAGVGHHS